MFAFLNCCLLSPGGTSSRKTHFTLLGRTPTSPSLVSYTRRPLFSCDGGALWNAETSKSFIEYEEPSNKREASNVIMTQRARWEIDWPQSARGGTLKLGHNTIRTRTMKPLSDFGVGLRGKDTLNSHNPLTGGSFMWHYNISLWNECQNYEAIGIDWGGSSTLKTTTILIP